MKNKEKDTSSKNSSANEFNSEFKNRFDIKSISMVMMIILLVTIIILWNPFDANNQQMVSATQTAQALTDVRRGQPYPPPFPTEMVEYREQTNGIVLGSVILVLIVVGGTLSVIQRKN